MRLWWSRTLDRMVPHLEDVPSSRRARFLGGLVLTLALLCLVLLAINIPRLDAIGVAVNLVLLAVCAGTLGLLRGPGLQPASLFFLAASTVALSPPAWFAGGAVGAGLACFMALVVGAAILSRPVVVIALMAWTIAVALFTMAVPPPAELLPPAGLHLALWSSALVLIGGGVMGLVGVTEEALSQANDRSEGLQRALGELESTTVGRDYLEGVLAALSEFIVVTDDAGTISSVNRAVTEAAGWSEQALMGESIDRLLPERADKHRQVTSFVCADGSRCAVLLQRNALPGTELLVWAATDISRQQATTEALRGAQERAEAASRAKSNFLANMSHELRTPLNAIIGYSELLEEQTTEAEMLADLQSISTASHTLLSLINGVLDLSRVEAGHVQVSLADCTLDEVVEPSLRLVEPLAAARGLELLVERPEQVVLHTDALRLGQVLTNLLTNAVKFTEQGQVTLTVECWERVRLPWLRLVVRDTGIGMTEEQLASAFEPFAQASDSKDSGLGGTGLGLSISQAYVELLGGQITATSEVGAGSCFTVEVPAGAIGELLGDPKH